MRTELYNRVMTSCRTAASLLDCEVSNGELPLQVELSDFICMFQRAALGEKIDPKTLQDAITRTQWMASTDMLPAMCKTPTSLAGFQALSIAANHLSPEAFA